MFEQTLIDSSPSRAPVLKGLHYRLSLALGILGSLLAFHVLPMAYVSNEMPVLIAQSAILGVLLSCSALMLCYVYADAHQLGFRVGVWCSIALLLNAAGFLVYLIYSAARSGNWKRATLPFAYLLEIGLVGVLVVVPLIYTEALPKAVLRGTIVPPSPPPPPVPRKLTSPVKVTKQMTVDVNNAPIIIPKGIVQITPEPLPPRPLEEEVGGGVPGGVPGGIPGGVPGGVKLDLGAPPPPPASPKPARNLRIRVGGQVEAAKLIFQPKPEYPALAKMARIQGTVRLEAIISKDGTITNLKVTSGHPLLVRAALDAVSRWRYQPTLLNGDPVEVVTDIELTFALTD